jgi:DNA invertase Pin-like site-specific DNA recombinase
LIRERTIAGLSAARARGNVGGRPSRMTPEKLAVAHRMLAEGTAKAVVAQTIGVSRPTLYAHLNHTAEITGGPGKAVPVPAGQRD